MEFPVYRIILDDHYDHKNDLYGCVAGFYPPPKRIIRTSMLWQGWEGTRSRSLQISSSFTVHPLMVSGPTVVVIAIISRANHFPPGPFPLIIQLLVTPTEVKKGIGSGLGR